MPPASCTPCSSSCLAASEKLGAQQELKSRARPQPLLLLRLPALCVRPERLRRFVPVDVGRASGEALMVEDRSSPLPSSCRVRVRVRGVRLGAGV